MHFWPSPCFVSRLHTAGSGAKRNAAAPFRKHLRKFDFKFGENAKGENT
jgi:hypothetical protein